MSNLFTKKYSPKKIDDIPQKIAMQALKVFVQTHKTQKKKAALLYGPTGTCKSCAVHTLAKELDLEIIEVNASDFRNSDQLLSKVGEASKQQSLFSQSKIILVDEVDGISGNADRGGVPTLASVIAETKFPIIMTANDPWDSKFSALRSKSVMIEFEQLDANAICNILKDICDKESIKYDETALKTLARRSGGDLRAALNDLQVLSIDNELTSEKLVQDLSRNKIDTLMDALIKILKSTDVSVAAGAFDNVEEELDMCMLWLEENVHKEYLNPADLARAYEALSKADVFLGRIRKRQHWRFLSYANTIMSAGVAVAKREKNKNFVKYSPTMRLLKIWQNNKKYAARNSVVEKLANQTHCSKHKTMQSTLPFAKQAFKNNQDFSASLIKTLKLEEEEIVWLNS